MSHSNSTTQQRSIFTDRDALQQLINQHPRTANTTYSYGTSGFRGLASTLPSVTLRMGFFAVLRALSYTSHQQSVGIQITASHNDAPDNGLKMIDADGSMLAAEWESYTDAVANADESEVLNVLQQTATRLNVITTFTTAPIVHVGRDTRESSPELASILRSAIEAMGGVVRDMNILTTPQLHWIVYHYNQGQHNVTVNDYNVAVSQSFDTALQSIQQLQSSKVAQLPLQPLIVDCSNGVGAVAMQELSSSLSKLLPLQLINTNVEDTSLVNYNCGAEHVHKIRALPTDISNSTTHNQRYASLDGDADRLIYWYLSDDKQLRVLDGDKIIVLYTLLIQQLLQQSQLDTKLKVGIIQTAYANGSSTNYIHDTLHIQTICTPTGVKHLHHAALEYDIGVYFESNGHGTVIFSDNATQLFKQASSGSDSTALAAKVLLSLTTLVNQYIGDAISDLLLCEVALYYFNWSIVDWNQLYADLPSQMLKCKVKDRNLVKTTDAERRCVEPAGLQSKINDLLNTYNTHSPATKNQRRTFVRPSGTEDVVRIYAEGSAPAEAKEIANKVQDIVQQILA